MSELTASGGLCAPVSRGFRSRLDPYWIVAMHIPFKRSLWSRILFKGPREDTATWEIRRCALPKIRDYFPRFDVSRGGIRYEVAKEGKH